MTRPTTTGKAQDLITFTRSTTGTYLGSDGLLKSAAINEARIEYDASGNCLGLLVEEARTNKVAYSQDFTNSYWTKNQLTVAPAPVAAPDGTMTATHAVKAGSNAFLIRLSTVSITDRHSIWARTVSGTGTMYIGGTAPDKLVTVTEEWQRLDVQCNNTNVYAASLREDATLTEVYIWGSQVETGTFPTSYIPTSGSAVTRAADIASLAVSEFGYNQDQGTIVIDWNTLGYSTVNNSGVLYGGASNARWIYSNINNTIHFSYDGTNSIVHGSIPAGQQTKLAMSVDSSTQQSSINGNAIASASHNGNIASNTSVFNIGHNQNAADLLTGHIKSVQYYPLRLSNAQLQALTV